MPDPDVQSSLQERNPERRSVVQFFGRLAEERVDLAPYTSFDGDVGFSVNRIGEVIGVHLAPEDAEQFAQSILDIVGKQRTWDTKAWSWPGWRFRRGN